MPYPSNFHRLVITGGLYSDTWATSLSLVPFGSPGSMGAPLVTPALLASVAGAVNTFWSTGGGSNVGATGSATLKSIKLNRIGPDGKYVDPVTMEHIYPTPVVGGGATGHPPQLAVVVTLRTAVERGLASKGRMYLPSCTGFHQLQTDGRATTTDAQRVANAAASFAIQLNSIYGALPSTDESRLRVGVASNTRAGEFRTALSVTVGRVPDTMRSRRSKQIESPVTAPVP